MVPDCGLFRRIFLHARARTDRSTPHAWLRFVFTGCSPFCILHFQPVHGHHNGPWDSSKRLENFGFLDFKKENSCFQPQPRRRQMLTIFAPRCTKTWKSMGSRFGLKQLFLYSAECSGPHEVVRYVQILQASSVIALFSL